VINSNIDFFEYNNNFEIHSKVDSILLSKKNEALTPLLSVIIPTYNCGLNILKEAIDSVLNQFGFNNFELIIVDNNPELNCDTHKFICQYSDKRIKYYKNSKNIGMYGNWNRGIELSASEWLIFLHDDDIMSPYFMLSCYSFLKDNSIALIKPFNKKFTESNELNFKQPKVIKLERLFMLDFIWGCEIGAPTNIIYNKKVLFEIGGFSNPFFPSADYVAAINIVKSHKVYRIPFELGGYRVAQNESLNPNTMRMFYLIRFHITSFIMRKFHLPFFLIELIQSALMPSLIISTNNYYNTNIPFDFCRELGIKPANRFQQIIIGKIFVLLRYSLALKRKINRNVVYFLKNKK
jgi:glycosyltransferase involved in cell wall biosynthesis